MFAFRSLTALLFLGLAILLNINLPLVAAQNPDDNPACPEKTSGNCTLTFTTHYWPGDGLFHMDAEVFDKDCHSMDSASYIYKATTLKGQLPKTIHMHNFTEGIDKIPVWYTYDGKLLQHKSNNCTHQPKNHKLICPEQFEC